MANELVPAEQFAVNLAALAREIAMDIFPVEQILDIHRLSDDEWLKIQANPRFRDMLSDMLRTWNSATNTKERIKTKAATGLETQLEIYVAAIADESIPLIQRVEAGKFLARLGELDGNQIMGGGGGAGVTINISTQRDMPPLVIEAFKSNPLQTPAIPVDEQTSA